MIEQANALTTQVQSERVTSGGGVAPARQQQTQEQQANVQQQPVTDTVTLSAEAIALGRNVTPATETPEAQETPTQETAVENAREQLSFGQVDIQA